MYAANRTQTSDPGPWHHPQRRRRGIVLILVLAMLSIMALIGVTFATLSGQAQVGARYFAEGRSNPVNPETYFDYSLNQLINDTNNPKSALRGHGLLRDMYGHPDLMRNPTTGAILVDPLTGGPLFRRGGYFPRLPAPVNQPMTFQNVTVNGNGTLTVVTNVPTNNNALIQQLPDLYSRNFTGWVVRVQQWAFDNAGNGRQLVPPIGQTFEVLYDDNVNGAYHVLTLSAPSAMPGLVVPGGPTQAPPPGFTTVVNLFELDGRYLGAFNGTGMSMPNQPNAIDPYAINFLFNNSSIPGGGFTNPDDYTTPSMDEDYDAVDHENVFLAWQSADGAVTIPSFHRPNAIVYSPLDPTQNDWVNPLNIARSKFLRPRKADHPASGDSFPDLIPDATTGKIEYDVDNDGDGVTDSVWIDLGFPAQRHANGKLFKPLFSFMVIGLNGRLPLNTAGNLQRRAPIDLDTDGDGTIDTQAGTPLYRHASHLGYSPFEVNPMFGLTNSNLFGVPIPPPDKLNGTELLRQLLTGTNEPPLAAIDPALPITPGRYGEAEVFQLGRAPGAGRSYNFNPLQRDFLDSNFNGYDFFPAFGAPGTTHPELPLVIANPQSANLLDASGRILLPSERMRYFVSPVDITGSGLVMEFDHNPAATVGLPYGPDAIKFGLGNDSRGRVSHFMYYRPPGMPAGAVVDANSDNSLLDEDITRNQLNRLNGYEAARNPGGRDAAVIPGYPAGTPAPREFMARAPFVLVPPIAATDLNKRLPTFDNQINSSSPVQLTEGRYPNGSMALNEDSQLNLFQREPFDNIFGAEDLEWLYRVQDTDGTSLSSRLPKLVQHITGPGTYYSAFEDDDTANGGLTAQTRRRLYSVDFWDLNRFSWSQNNFSPGNTPSLMHGNKKLNLNYPLPISDAYDEPVRLQWCAEAYTLMKQILYPQTFLATFDPLNLQPNDPRPEDLARLSQFVVNIVDFRDPDATMTRFENPDLKLRPAETAGGDTNGNGVIEPAGVAYAADSSVPTTGPLVQWGMENLPVALSEVLAYQFTRKDLIANPPQQPTQRLFIEMVNTLTQDGDGTVGKGGTASDLDLNGWGFVITADNPNAPAVPTVIERPNTVTGQLEDDTIKVYYVPFAGTAAAPLPLPATELVKALEAEPNGNALPDYPTLTNIPAANPQDEYFVIGNALAPTNNNSTGGALAETNPPQRVSLLADQLVQQLPRLPIGSGDAEYFWIHLVRPANPNAANMAVEPKVVVDSMRFPYTEGGGTITNPNTPAEQVTVGTRPLYSVGRLQPYRGGHAVPDSHRFTPPYPYGWSEQTTADLNSANSPDTRGRYDQQTMAGYITVDITGNIEHSLGVLNDSRESWDHFPFLDRDFVSVTELMLVPECPPGLFTKKFVEDTGRPYPIDAADGFPGAYPHITPPTPTSVTPSAGNAPDLAYIGGNMAQPPDLTEPPTYPYLPQRFHYWNTSRPNDRAAWYQLFEFLEVPSPVNGAIGPVAQGDNGDWLRKDLRPGALNLNLIIDEEAFFGLVDDPRLNRAEAFIDYPTAFANNTGVPRVVTSIDAQGNPTYSQPISELDPAGTTASLLQGRGFYDPITGKAVMKAAFADFIKMRHGGSGYIGLLPNINRPLGTPFIDDFPFYPEKPFRSATALRPLGGPDNGLDIYNTAFRPARMKIPSGDKGTMPDRLAIPPRRLFQVPDQDNASDPASETGDFLTAGFPATPLNPDHLNLLNFEANLFDPVEPGAPLGSGAPGPGTDRRRHPRWQGEMLQKVINNSTVRTHQYAVWITVGLFEVVQEGDASKVGIDPNLAIDRLGKEIGRDSGQQVRYRMFCLVDRTRAIGFDPRNPEDFRNLVVYQRRIE